MQPKKPSNPGRRKFLIAATSVVGAVGVAGAAIPFLAALSPSARAKAAGAPIKADISKLAKGEMMLVEWRGLPIYIIRHSKESLEMLDKNLSSLSDPNSEENQQPEYARNKNRFLGLEKEPRPGLKSGSIKDSYCLPFSELINPDNRTFLDKNLIKEKFKQIRIDKENNVVFSCGSGITAAVLSLAYSLINDNYLPTVYDGSWAEYGKIN